ncbi:glutathione S-transferase T3-like [Raphanus sativus]|uniref:Glutathione S-transferase T3-like n=1 Tax=Raphanus sativus TaxID=3726 RepID=A0A9W3CLB7_RAPSA|nr:glutathione S-transferase T3-like [Raphanus sativus]
MDPSTGASKFVDLLCSQQCVSFGNYEDSVSLSSSQLPFVGSQGGEASSGFDGDTPAEPKGRQRWTASDDVVLISAWLNTSKDPVVNNEQRAGAFWRRVADYYAASQEATATQREPKNCKHRWHRINDEVSKFCGAYEAATREKTSGQNENDVLKNAHRIFLAIKNKKFTLEHAWKELRYDQKWCDLGTAKTNGRSKKRKCDDVAESSPSEATANKHPPGIKAAKASGKKKVQSLGEFESMWTIKREDLKMKQGNHRMSLLDKLMGKKEPLTESEEALKQKLIDDMMSP